MKRTTRSERAKGRASARDGGLFSHVLIPALLSAVLFLHGPAPARAMQILDAVDHAELEAEISDRAVSRIALVDDRVARVIRGPDGFVVEHDAARGDVYLRPTDRSGVRIGGGVPGEPVTLFIGTAGGFTYRLALTVAERGSAQILIRNAAAVSEPDFPKPGDPHVGALVELTRAVVRREALAGYAIEALSESLDGDGLAIIEIWRGARFTVRVLEVDAGPGTDAPALAGRLVPGTAAIWLAPPGTGPSGGRLAVAVYDGFRTGPSGATR